MNHTVQESISIAPAIVLEAGIKQVFKFQALVSVKLNLLAA